VRHSTLIVPALMKPQADAVHAELPAFLLPQRREDMTQPSALLGLE
jgi:hypothetical protein